MLRKKYRRFKAWLNYDPPGALTGRGWKSFKKEFKERAPIRYWITHDLYKSVVLPIKWKKEAIQYWIRCRTYDRYHVVKTGLPPGYQGVDSQIFHASFNLLVDFVEVEQAYSSRYHLDPNSITWKEKYIPFYNLLFPFRRPDLGVRHFEWASKLDDPSLPPNQRMPEQAQAAREILELYNWWKARKHNRIHPPLPKLTGGDDIFDHIDRNSPEYKEYVEALDKQQDQEEAWAAEDDMMLIRLMKIRKSLWT